MAKNIELPMDFRLVRANLPVDIDRQLGYMGDARFVGLYWDAQGDDIAWNDGKDKKVGGADWEAFIRYVSPIAQYFAATFGRMEEEATHLFVWDRAQRLGYVALREDAEKFLEAQHG